MYVQYIHLYTYTYILARYLRARQVKSEQEKYETIREEKHVQLQCIRYS